MFLICVISFSYSWIMSTMIWSRWKRFILSFLKIQMTVCSGLYRSLINFIKRATNQLYILGQVFANIDVADEFRRRNILVTNSRCWRQIFKWNKSIISLRCWWQFWPMGQQRPLSNDWNGIMENSENLNVTMPKLCKLTIPHIYRESKCAIQYFK